MGVIGARIRKVSACLLVGTLAGTSAVAEVASNSYTAATNYTLNCAGCHKADGSGQAAIVPSFRGQIARYLAAPEGRAYIARVPGSAQSLLSSENLAQVLNWTLENFDREHLPATFEPYRAEEVASLRREPLSAPSAVHARIMALVDAGPAGYAAVAGSGGTAEAAGPPAAFAICSACHSVAATGDNSIGPNLRNVVGRRSGTAPGFGYSTAMKEAGIVWSEAQLDSFLTDVNAKVPGTLMTYSGVAEPADRQAIIAYLKSLQN